MLHGSIQGPAGATPGEIRLIARGNRVVDGPLAGYFRYVDAVSGQTYYKDQAEPDEGNGVLLVAGLALVPVADPSTLRLLPRARGAATTGAGRRQRHVLVRGCGGQSFPA